MLFSLSSLAWVSLTLISPRLALSVAVWTAVSLIGSVTLVAPAWRLGHTHLDAILQFLKAA